ncbi:uncharacterized protein LOC125072193 [Vanessa atalanta]|uniref:uncharacterized protein LOC125072193 n=1 Tax=Vanessa atalanta TaxID=42275 RepID=UPI001FCE0D01|nr:uncharacterized protein LOC125072193 [Vanessa atalanta]
MRVQLFSDIASGAYAQKLLEIGEGLLGTDQDGMIPFTQQFCHAVESEDELIEKVFPNMQQNIVDENWLCERTILAPKNETITKIYKKILAEINTETSVYNSIDTVMSSDDTTNYPVEFLNSLELSGVPSHKLELKVGEPVLLMRNLDAPRLCNGTRLRVTELGRHIVKATILTGEAKGDNVIIPRIPIIPNNLPFNFKRLQFPLKVAFSMTINKSQGQTLKVAGIHLGTPCFSHGSNHSAKECRTPVRCSICKRTHHSLLHPKDANSSEENKTECVVNSSEAGKKQQQVLLATALVKTICRNGNEYSIRALLDQGSQASFVTESTVQYLGLKKTGFTSQIAGLGGN